MKNIFKYRLIENSERELLYYWYSSFLYKVYFNYNIESKEKFLKKIDKFLEKNIINIIIIDNIRIGAKFEKKNNKNFIFLNPIFYINQYYDIKIIQKFNIIRKNYLSNAKVDYFKDSFSKNLICNIDIKEKNQSKLKIDQNLNILILGPNERNKKILAHLNRDRNNTEIHDRKISINSKILNNKDLLISSGYSHLIKQDIVNKFKGRIINLHATFLPWGKGIGTTLNTFLLNVPAGVSYHLIDKNFDTGKIIFRKLFTPNKNDTTRLFYSKLINNLNDSFIKDWKVIKKLNFVTHSQNKDNLRINYFSRLDFEKLIEILPLGYDTKLLDLLVIGFICRNNLKLFQFIK